VCLGLLWTSSSSSDELQSEELGGSGFFRRREPFRPSHSESVEALRAVLLEARVRSFFLLGVWGDVACLMLGERWDFLAGECWLWPSFASAGSAARLDVPWWRRVKCWVRSTLPFDFAFGVGRGGVSDTCHHHHPLSSHWRTAESFFPWIVTCGWTKCPPDSVRLLSAFWPYGRQLGRIYVRFCHWEFFL